MKIKEDTKKGLFFAIGVLLSSISVFNFDKNQFLFFILILVGIFFIVKALS